VALETVWYFLMLILGTCCTSISLRPLSSIVLSSKSSWLSQRRWAEREVDWGEGEEPESSWGWLWVSLYFETTNSSYDLLEGEFENLCFKILSRWVTNWWWPRDANWKSLSLSFSLRETIKGTLLLLLEAQSSSLNDLLGLLGSI